MTKRQAVATAKATLAAITAEVSTLVSVVYGRERVRLAVLIANGADEFVDGVSVKLSTGTMTADWREWASDALQGEETPPGIYRLRNAGQVARVLGDETGDAAIRTLVPLYRILAAAKGEEAVTAAHTLIRELWASAQETSSDGKPPTEEVVAKLTAKVAAKGTRGKQAAKGKKKPKTPETPSVPEETGSADRDACTKQVARILGRYSSDRDAYLEAVTIMLATVKLRETFASTTLEAIVKQEKGKAPAAAKVAA